MGCRVPVLVAFLVLLLAAPSLADDPPAKGNAEELAKTLVSGENEDDRIAAGLALARTDPAALAKALDDVIKGKREGDQWVLSACAVRSQVRHIRLLFTWAASKFDGVAEAFLDKIDLDHPKESRRAAECLGFLRASSAFDKLLTLCREEDELIAIQAARALGRIGTRRNASEAAARCMDVDNSHVRLHMAWAVQDMVGSRKKAMGYFARYAGKKGTIGYRAKEAEAALEDELARPEPYKVKLDEVRKHFGKRVKRPPVDSSDKDAVKRVEEALDEMEKKAPDWYHMVCSTVQQIQIAGDQKLFDFRARILKLQFTDMVRWDRTELIEYYIIRFVTIMFLQQMGDPCEGHRGWEEGIAEAWYYAWAHTKIAVDEDLSIFMKQTLNGKPW